MKRIRVPDEIGEVISAAKAKASAYCTNLFLSPRKLQGWIEHGEILCEEGDDTALFLRKDRDFWHLYFCSSSPEQLQQALADFSMIKTESVVVDLVGRETDLGNLEGIFTDAGFRCYQRLFRMARVVSPVAPSSAGLDSRVTVADKSDCQSIHDLLLRSFDRHAEQIPMPYEIEEAIAACQIRVVKANGVLAGLLFFETQGLSSTLRYWLVAPEFQSQGFGSGLMHRYFADNPEVRRYLLWVISANANAIDKYEHYGFVPDGLVDQVLANERICS